jgi:hypothetical protein
LVGTWKVSFNNHEGTLVFTASGATLNLGDGQEALTNVRFDPANGAVSFTRPLLKFGAGNQQVYTGRLARDGFAEGLFDCTISGKGFKWSITRTSRDVPGGAPARDTVQPPKPQVIFNNWNTGGVGVGPTVATTFKIDRPARVTYLNSYHYNYGRGTKTGTLALRHSDGTLYGPWTVKGSTASGAPNGLWETEPGVVLKPGAYTVIDSDPSTWSNNGQSGSCGFAEVRGFWAGPREVTPAPAASDSEAWVREWTVAATSGDLANGGPVGFYRSGPRGDANPPAGRTGMLYLHPPSPGVPAVLERRVRLGRSPVLHLSVAGNSPSGGVRGDWQLTVKLDGRPVGAPRTIDGGDGWRDLDYDLAAGAGRDALVTLEAAPTGWSFEYVFIDSISISSAGASVPPSSGIAAAPATRSVPAPAAVTVKAATAPVAKPALTPTAPKPAATRSAVMVEVVFENRSSQNAHIFVDGRDSFGPQNRLTPGQKRTVSVELSADGRLKFVAGRNGQVLARGTWNGDPSDLSRYPVVRFAEDGSPALLVTTGLR